MSRTSALISATSSSRTKRLDAIRQRGIWIGLAALLGIERFQYAMEDLQHFTLDFEVFRMQGLRLLAQVDATARKPQTLFYARHCLLLRREAFALPDERENHQGHQASHNDQRDKQRRNRKACVHW